MILKYGSLVSDQEAKEATTGKIVIANNDNQFYFISFFVLT
jgi:hypothetical protein